MTTDVDTLRPSQTSSMEDAALPAPTRASPSPASLTSLPMRTGAPVRSSRALATSKVFKAGRTRERDALLGDDARKRQPNPGQFAVADDGVDNTLEVIEDGGGRFEVCVGRRLSAGDLASVDHDSGPVRDHGAHSGAADLEAGRELVGGEAIDAGGATGSLCGTDR